LNALLDRLPLPAWPGIAFVLVLVATGQLFGSLWYGLAPAVLAALGVWVLLARRTWAQVSVRTRAMEKLMQPPKGFDPTRPQTAGGWKPPFERVEVELEEIIRQARWLPLVPAQYSGQLGQIRYFQKKYDTAQPALERAWNNDWMARMMLGAIHYRRRNYDAMKKVFDAAVKANPKVPLLVNVQAWCLHESGHTEDAIRALDAAVALSRSTHEVAEQNLQNLRNGRRMNMKPFQEHWYALFLEDPPRVMVGPTGPPQPRMSRRPR
jgi:tetratricopeptide (TPR) repeat protein